MIYVGQERIAMDQTPKSDPAPGRTPQLNTTAPEVRETAEMRSRPTGVQTSRGSVNSQQDL